MEFKWGELGGVSQWRSRHSLTIREDHGLQLSHTRYSCWLPFLTWDFFFFLILFPYSPYSQAHPKRIPARSNEKKKRKSPIIKRTQVQARGIFDSLLPFASPRSASAPAPAILHPSYRLPFSQLQLLLLLLALMPEPQLRRTAFSKCL